MGWTAAAREPHAGGWPELFLLEWAGDPFEKECRRSGEFYR
jgi:hypothetical protein